MICHGARAWGGVVVVVTWEMDGVTSALALARLIFSSICLPSGLSFWLEQIPLLTVITWQWEHHGGHAGATRRVGEVCLTLTLTLTQTLTTLCHRDPFWDMLLVAEDLRVGDLHRHRRHHILCALQRLPCNAVE